MAGVKGPISTHFSFDELTADGLLLDNTPTDEARLYLAQLAWTVLEPIRELLACPLQVSSGYRGPAVERAVQEAVHMIAPGAPLHSSQHLLGQAADIEPIGDLSVEQAFETIYASTVPFDQLLLEGPPGRQWIHVSCAPATRPPRRMALTSADGLHFVPYQETTT
jgi:zinc D-Ala-D-Ala carboxypeptidase